MSNAWRPRFALALRLCVGTPLVVAGVSKLGNPEDFLANIYAYRFPFPDFLLRTIAMGIPWLEFISGVLIISGGLLFGEACAWAAVLLTAFLLASVSAWARGLEIGCGCFGPETLAESQGGLLRALESPLGAIAKDLLLGLAIACLVYMRRRSIFFEGSDVATSD